MKKFFGIGLLALLATAYLTSSCSRDDLSGSLLEAKKATFNENFVAEYGQIAPNHDWGFGLNNGTRAFTRSITAKNGDVYDQFNFPTDADISAAFPEAVPDGATQIPTEQVQEQAGMSNGDWNFYVNKGGANFVIETAGDYSIGAGWMNTKYVQDSSHPYGGYTTVDLYNVYVNVTGNVTISRCGDPHFNLYILSGNVTLASDFGQMGGIISVADGATLNDNRASLACNYGTSLFNRGTVNTGAYDIGNNARVYNEGKFTATGALSYSAGAGNASYFINFGTGELKAPSMTMNSECHFYTGGKVTIDGLTKVTQSGITWINEGHYTTGTMEFGAGNTTFYNYCQLKVNGNCKFRDGVFNMMNGSYAEFGTIQVNNFHVNLYNNSGFNVLNGGKFGRNGAGLYQGFFAVDGATAYIRLGGDVYIPLHKDYSFQVTGANLVLAYSSGLKFYNNMTIANGSNDICSEEYANVTYSGETNEDGQEMYRWKLNDVTKIVTGSDFSQIRVTAAAYPSCSTTWNVPNITPPSPKRIVLKQAGRVFCEDLGTVSSSDIDYNDVVFDAWLYVERTGDDESTDVFHKAFIQLLAAGGTILIKVADVNVHKAFGYNNDDVMINTYSEGESQIGGAKHAEYGTDFSTLPEKIVITDASYVTGDDGQMNIFYIPITVRTSDNKAVELTSTNSVTGGSTAPLKFMAPLGTPWAAERVKFGKAYPMFRDWVGNKDKTPWSLPSETATFDNSGLPLVAEYAPTDDEIGSATSTVTDPDTSGQGTQEEETPPTFSSVTGTELSIGDGPKDLTQNSGITLPAASFNGVSAATVYVYGTGDGEVLVNGVSATTVESSAPRFGFGFTRSATPVVKACQLGPSNLKTNRVVITGYNFKVYKCSMVNQTGNYSVSEPSGKGDIIYNTSTILDWGDNGGAITITHDKLKNVQIGSTIRAFGIGYAASYWEVQTFGFNTTGAWNTSTKINPKSGTSFTGNGAKEIEFPITSQDQVNMVKGGSIVVQGYNFILKYVTVENSSSSGSTTYTTVPVWSGENDAENWTTIYSGNGDKFKDAKVGDILKITAHPVNASAFWQFNVANGSYGDVYDYTKSDTNGQTISTSGYQEIELTQSAIDNLKAGGMMTYKNNLVFTAVDLLLKKN